MIHGVVTGAPASPDPYSLDDLAHRHREFLSLQWQGVSPAEVQERFFAHYGMLPIVIMSLPGPALGCDRLHRARWLDPRKEDVELCDTFCYPKEPARQVMGRANLTGYPVFYTCGSADNSIHEASSGRHGNTELFRSEWLFNDAEDWKVAPMIPPDRIERNEAPYGGAWDNAIRHYVSQGGEAPQEYLLLLYDFVTELFLSTTYEVTSWMAHRIMQELGSAQMMIYPSLRSNEKGLCHAFHTAPIDAGRVTMHAAEHLRPAHGKVMLVRRATVEGQMVRWIDVDPPEERDLPA